MPGHPETSHHTPTVDNNLPQKANPLKAKKLQPAKRQTKRLSRTSTLRQTKASNRRQKTHNNYMKDTISSTDTSYSKRFRSYINRKKHSSISILKDTNGIINNESNAKKILKDQFSSVFNSTPTKATKPDKEPSPHPSTSLNNIN